jgi:hypothetical protein
VILSDRGEGAAKGSPQQEMTEDDAFGDGASKDFWDNRRRNSNFVRLGK